MGIIGTRVRCFWCLVTDFLKKVSFSPFPPAFSTAKCEKLQKEKEELERRFEEEVRKLGWQQQAELQELEERLQLQFEAEVVRLQEEQHAQLLRIRSQHEEQVSVPLRALPLLPGHAAGRGRGAGAAAVAGSPALQVSFCEVRSPTSFLPTVPSLPPLQPPWSPSLSLLPRHAPTWELLHYLCLLPGMLSL